MKGRRLRRPQTRVLIALGTTVTLACVGLAFMLVAKAEDHGSMADVLSSILAVAVTAIGAISWLWSKRDRAAATDLDDKLVADLSEALSRQWSREAHARGLIAPAPVELSWRLDGGVSERAVASALAPPPKGTAPLEVPGAATLDAGWLGGEHSVEDLHDLYVGLPSGRVVLIGGEATGKSSVLVLLLLAALGHRDEQFEKARRRIPVPVLLTLATWNPPVTLEAFVVESLLRDHPFLRTSTGDGTDVARRLLTQGRLSLLLDGLDEMPETDSAKALLGIDQMASVRTVVSSRPARYAQASGQHRLHRSLAVELQPVSPGAAATYLRHQHDTADRGGWEDVAQELLAHPCGPLAQALDTPLMITLAKEAYPSGAEPGELVDQAVFPSEAAIERHLIDQMLTATYGTPSSVTAGARRRDERAEKWLEHIAHQVAGNDLFWPAVGAWVPTRASRLIYGAVFGAICSAAALLAIAPSALHPHPVGTAAAWGIAGLVAYVVAATTDARVTGVPVAGMSFGVAAGALPGLLAGMALGLWLADRSAAAGTPSSLVVPLGIGLAAGVACAVVLAVTFVTLGMRNPRMAARRTWPSTLGRGSVTRPCLLLSLFVALVFAVSSEPGSAALAAGVAFGGISIGLFSDILLSTQGAAPCRATSSPEASLKGDLAGWAMVGVTVGTGQALISGFIFGNGLAGGLGWLGVSFVIALASSHTSGFALAVASTAMAGEGPLRLLAFLRDAQERQVLRRVGWAYQFRHRRLQERLAERYADRLDPGRELDVADER